MQKPCRALFRTYLRRRGHQIVYHNPKPSPLVAIGIRPRDLYFDLNVQLQLAQYPKRPTHPPWPHVIPAGGQRKENERIGYQESSCSVPLRLPAAISCPWPTLIQPPTYTTTQIHYHKLTGSQPYKEWSRPSLRLADPQSAKRSQSTLQQHQRSQHQRKRSRSTQNSWGKGWKKIWNYFCTHAYPEGAYKTKDFEKPNSEIRLIRITQWIKKGNKNAIPFYVPKPHIQWNATKSFCEPSFASLLLPLFSAIWIPE